MKYITYAISLIGFLSSKTLHGNVMWPALIMMLERTQHYVIYIIALTIGFLLELYIVKKLAPQASHDKAFFVTLVMNLVSITLGSIIILFIDLLVVIGFDIVESLVPYKFLTLLSDPILSLTYIHTPILFCIAIAINTIIEGYIASVYFKEINKKRLYFYIFLANTLSAVIDVGGIVIRTLI